MPALRPLLAKLIDFFRKEKLDRDVADEMQFHINQRTADQADDGLAPEDARYAALRKFGNVFVIQERARDERSVQIRGHPIEVVGVAHDSRYSALPQGIPPTVFLPFRQDISGQANFEVRTNANPLTMASAIRATVHRVDPDLPIFDLRSQDEQINQMMAEERRFALLSAFFAGVALLLTSIGLYGLLANQAVAHTREICIRMALGARLSSVVILVLAEGMSLAVIGVVCGSFAAFGSSGFVAHLLYGVLPHDHWSLAGAGIGLLFVTILACVIPARRAAKVDPMVALRCD